VSGTEKRHVHSLHSRAENEDGSPPLYKDSTAAIEDRVNDLLPRMTLEEKVAQLCVCSLLLPMHIDVELAVESRETLPAG